MLRTACQDLCLAEKSFLCRAITYDYGRRVCRLYRETRRSKPNAFKPTSDFVDYFENKCANGKSPRAPTINHSLAYRHTKFIRLSFDECVFLSIVHKQICPHASIGISKIATLSMLIIRWLRHRWAIVNANAIPSWHSTASRSTLTRSVGNVRYLVKIPFHSQPQCWMKRALVPPSRRRVSIRASPSFNKIHSSVRKATASKVSSIEQQQQHYSLIEYHVIEFVCTFSFVVSVQCNQQDMMLTLNFESPFHGRVYTKSNPSQCFVTGNGQTQLQVRTMSYDHSFDCHMFVSMV